MQTDKEFAMRIVDQLEEYYLRCTLMETILDASKVSGWRKQFAGLFPDPEIRGIVHKQFDPVRNAVLDAPDLTAAVREMLRGIPGTDPAD
jgi:hypothetical protein